MPVNFAYKLDLVTDPRSPQVTFNQRRVDTNVLNAMNRLNRDPIPYDTQIVPLTPGDKLFDRDPDA